MVHTERRLGQAVLSGSLQTSEPILLPCNSSSFMHQVSIAKQHTLDKA